MDIDVLIIGAGPTGLVAAIDARRHGLSVRIIDQNPQRSPHSKALVLHSRSLEVLDDLGCVAPALRAGREFRALNILAGTRPVGHRGPAQGRLAAAGRARGAASLDAGPDAAAAWRAHPDGVMHRAFAAHRPLAVWVRPDKYVGFRGDARSTGALRAYLDRLFMRRARSGENKSS